MNHQRLATPQATRPGATRRRAAQIGQNPIQVTRKVRYATSVIEARSAGGSGGMTLKPSLSSSGSDRIKAAVKPG